MWTIWAVCDGELEYVDEHTGEEHWHYVCFWPEDKALAEKFAEEHDEEVEEWTIPSRDLHELDFWSGY